MTFRGRVYLDCCALLNVYATQRFDEILTANRSSAPEPFGVAKRVVELEALYVRNGGGNEREQVDLHPSIARGVIVVEEIQTEHEVATFVDLATVLDDGEAETGALAFHRSGAVATDDAAAIRVLTSMTPAIPIVRTSALMKGWADTGKPAAVLVRQALNDIRDRARFTPGPADPLREWWLQAAA